ncbi:hypothetical protein [Mucilaginibacter sp. CSA2-8R]|uniref:hypothetical protein n=1 Tax=Mucilaginibacter sp. CSA2-8R TaxID=3141542 RepID=UPI00315D406F
MLFTKQKRKLELNKYWRDGSGAVEHGAVEAHPVVWQAVGLNVCINTVVLDTPAAKRHQHKKYPLFTVK